MEYVWLMLFPAFRINPTAYRSQKPNPKHSMKSISHDSNVKTRLRNHVNHASWIRPYLKEIRGYFSRYRNKIKKTKVVILVLGGSKRNSTLQRFQCMNAKLTCMASYGVYTLTSIAIVSMYTKRHKWHTFEVLLYKNQNLNLCHVWELPVTCQRFSRRKNYLKPCLCKELTITFDQTS